MPFLCPTCKENIHVHLWTDTNGKRHVGPCSLDPFLILKTDLDIELRAVVGSYLGFRFLSSLPDDLRFIEKSIPAESLLQNHARLLEKNGDLFLDDLIIYSSIPTFLKHYFRILLDYQHPRGPHCISADQIAQRGQFTSLWLAPTCLKNCYFGNKEGEDRFKSMNSLHGPRLVIYPLGVEEVHFKNWGNALHTIMTGRNFPTWIVVSKPPSQCSEIIRGDELREYFSLNTKFKKITLEELSYSKIENTPIVKEEKPMESRHKNMLSRYDREEVKEKNIIVSGGHKTTTSNYGND